MLELHTLHENTIIQSERVNSTIVSSTGPAKSHHKTKTIDGISICMKTT